jgi:Xaa-Pro aminopeptidase
MRFWSLTQNVAWAFNIRGADVTHTPLALAFALVPWEGRPALYIDSGKVDNNVHHALEEFTDVRGPDDLARDLGKLGGKTIRLDQASASDAFALACDHGGKPRASRPIALLKATNHAENRRQPVATSAMGWRSRAFWPGSTRKRRQAT